MDATLGEKGKMLAGALYDPRDAQLVAERHRAKRLCDELMRLDPADGIGRQAVIARLLQWTLGEDSTGTDADIVAPFHCDYGYNLRLGRKVYLNAGCVVLDVMPVAIGDNALLGPGVHLYAATHPMDPVARRTGLEHGRRVVVGNDVWIGGHAIVCPGVTIGDGSVIGAGSVVTRDVPAGVFAAGNPCRVVRPIHGDDRRDGTSFPKVATNAS